MGAKESSLGKNSGNRESKPYFKNMTDCFGSCPLEDIKFKKEPYEGKRCSDPCHNRLVKKTLKYGNKEKHDLTREEVLELFDDLKI